MEINEFIINSVEEHPKDIVHIVMDKFGISRPAVHKHLKTLMEEGKLSALGTTRNRRYFLNTKNKIYFNLPFAKSQLLDDFWAEKILPITKALPRNIINICEQGLSLAVSNIQNHSLATQVEITCDFTGQELKIVVTDDGVGIFEKISSYLKLDSHREAILHLTKGKLTTAPHLHTGEGLFFASRLFDTFILEANSLRYTHFDNGDWLIEDSHQHTGTAVTLKIDRNSSKEVNETYKKFGESRTEYSFSKTEVVVKLSLMPGESHISRNQAKKLLKGLDQFKHILLDFERVDTVGQGFVDEIFRVFKSDHPHIDIVYKNANENVEFMIRRSL